MLPQTLRRGQLVIRDSRNPGCLVSSGLRGSSETLQTPLFTLILATASLVQLPQTPSQSFRPCGS
ncbi:hypothetical protein CGCA056_v008909 [Colletotrichum aenigma]|uniref:uncharacterized protein n=1 Tax=Colletotrichum aenigma TaxID=1215731 RepID=UPI00187308CB|nr:uncharacterized protein CGCA056_v008909 [Colletotrichum aenigma]KAF5521056.1 hypothetical protein CGCA056_v008909 [Colletotrichum aenigma]